MIISVSMVEVSQFSKGMICSCARTACDYCERKAWPYWISFMNYVKRVIISLNIILLIDEHSNNDTAIHWNTFFSAACLLLIFISTLILSVLADFILIDRFNEIICLSSA